MKKALSFKGVVASFIVASLLVGCSNTEEAVQEERPVPVEVADASFGNLSGSNQIIGTIVSEGEVSVVPKAAGQLVEVNVSRGDTVQRGDVLARIDSTDERNALEQEKVRYRQAQTALERAQSGKSQAQTSVAQSEASLRQAEAQLAEAREARKNNLNSMELDIRNAEIAYEEASKNVERMSGLYEDDLITSEQYEEAVNAKRRAKTALDQVKLAESQARSEASIQAMEASVDQARLGVQTSKAAVGDTDIGIREARSGIEQAELALEQAQKRVDDKVITAPASGEIVMLNGSQGELVSNQAEFAQILSLDTVKVSVTVTAEQLLAFERGDEVEVEVAGIDEPMTGVISYISSTSAGSGLFTVEAELDNSGRDLRPGMVASIVLEEILASDNVIVPTEAVLERQGETYLFVVQDGIAVRKEVEVVRYDTVFTAISGDVSESDKVVIKGQNLLEDGNLVQVMEEE